MVTTIIPMEREFQGKESTKDLARPGSARVAATHKYVTQFETLLRANGVSKF